MELNHLNSELKLKHPLNTVRDLEEKMKPKMYTLTDNRPQTKNANYFVQTRTHKHRNW